MATNNDLYWAILHVSGGETTLGDLSSSFFFDLAIYPSQSDGVIINIVGFPTVNIPMNVKVASVLVSGAVTEFIISFNGTWATFAASGSMTIGVAADAKGTCNYEFQHGKATFSVVNAEVTWLQQPQ
jgi:hypothetical protein